ncbi:hypothetical protein DB30_05455 [Enhygromyxa salina]|uniref:Uncharacterized protein n=1 Tax=Enhygromyxa salina TaxID=215803 RepID=A0A0C2CX19_9BACT|nr:hypothetical protein DB30_05455 [Enhygromyxa salina]
MLARARARGSEGALSSVSGRPAWPGNLALLARRKNSQARDYEFGKKKNSCFSAKGGGSIELAVSRHDPRCLAPTRGSKHLRSRLWVPLGSIRVQQRSRQRLGRAHVEMGVYDAEQLLDRPALGGPRDQEVDLVVRVERRACEVARAHDRPPPAPSCPNDDLWMKGTRRVVHHSHAAVDMFDKGLGARGAMHRVASRRDFRRD